MAARIDTLKLYMKIVISTMAAGQSCSYHCAVCSVDLVAWGDVSVLISWQPVFMWCHCRFAVLTWSIDIKSSSVIYCRGTYSRPYNSSSLHLLVLENKHLQGPQKPPVCYYCTINVLFTWSNETQVIVEVKSKCQTVNQKWGVKSLVVCEFELEVAQHMSINSNFAA